MKRRRVKLSPGLLALGGAALAFVLLPRLSRAAPAGTRVLPQSVSLDYGQMLNTARAAAADDMAFSIPVLVTETGKRGVVRYGHSGDFEFQQEGMPAVPLATMTFYHFTSVH